MCTEIYNKKMFSHLPPLNLKLKIETWKYLVIDPLIYAGIYHIV